MWTKAFWKATAERMIRGAAVTVAAVFFGGDLVFDSFNFDTWEQFFSLAVAGALGSLVLSLAGNSVSGNGPSFTTDEKVVK